MLLSGANSYLTAYNAEATLTGTGEVVLGGSAGNKIRQDYGGSLVNDIQHTIRGAAPLKVSPSPTRARLLPIIPPLL